MPLLIRIYNQQTLFEPTAFFPFEKKYVTSLEKFVSKYPFQGSFRKNNSVASNCHTVLCDCGFYFDSALGIIPIILF